MRFAICIFFRPLGPCLTLSVKMLFPYLHRYILIYAGKVPMPPLCLLI